MTTANILVQEFQDAFDVKDADLYAKLVHEEAKEVVEAAEHLLKELADFVYVSAGFENAGGESSSELYQAILDDKNAQTAAHLVACLFPVNITWEAFKRVHESNMSKLDDDGKPIRREDGKVLKGPNYKPPVLTDLI